MPSPIIIIGSGYSAAAVLLHLSAAGVACADVTVVGPGRLGAGQAYGCVEDEFRLNVRPDLMRLWLDRPMHFADWATTHINDPAAATSAGAFYRRRDFEAYMTAQLAAISDREDLVHMAECVTSVAPDAERRGGWIVTLASGKRVMARTVILATGNPDPKWPLPIQPNKNAVGLVATPWRGEWVENIPTAAPVAIVGAGLTAMDAIHALASHGHSGPITVIAPHGKLPPVQLPWQPGAPFIWPDAPLRASGFVRVMRRHLGRGSWNDVAWQERFEELRVHCNEAWQKLSASDRKKLRSRLGWLWSLVRFRAGPQSVSTAERLKATGQLTITTGRLMQLDKQTQGWIMQLGDKVTPAIAADWVINCTGMGRDVLLNDLVESGVVGATADGDLIVQPSLQLVDADGSPHDTLFMIGPSTAASLGDVIGSASISRQAHLIAQSLSRSVA